MRLLITALKPVYAIYKRWLKRQIKNGPIPQHVAIILDGNRRWALKKELLPWEGHKAGAKKVEEVLQWCLDLGIRNITLYVFSTENFKRPKEEVERIMDIAEEALEKVLRDKRIDKYKVRIKAIGRIHMLPSRVQRAIRKVEEKTRDYSDYLLTIAIGYGGRAEIIDAVKELSKDIRSGKLNPEDIDERVFEKYLYTAGIPDPDLIIRTSGEERLSGFLLWQSAYSELYFCDVFWPEFREIDLWRAIRTFQRRERRFGA